MDFSEFLYGLWQNIELLAIPVLLFLSYRYLRALFKRFSLLRVCVGSPEKKGIRYGVGAAFTSRYSFPEPHPN